MTSLPTRKLIVTVVMDRLPKSLLAVVLSYSMLSISFVFQSRRSLIIIIFLSSFVYVFKLQHFLGILKFKASLLKTLKSIGSCHNPGKTEKKKV